MYYDYGQNLNNMKIDIDNISHGNQSSNKL